MNAPARVRERFQSLKSEYDHIYLRNIRGMFYIYRVLSRSENGKVKTTSEYIGRITEEGAFIKREMNKEDKKLELARAIIEERGGKVVMPQPRAYDEEQREGEEGRLLAPSEEENKVLTILSMNGRARMKSIGKLLGITAQASVRKVRAIEKKYGLTYTAEIDPIKVGFLEFLVFIKFDGPVPSTQEIRSAFERQPIVQFCALMKGSYDVMLYVLVDVNNVYPQLEQLQFESLTSFNSVWYLKSGYSHYGFIPVRDKFFELLKERIWHRKKGVKEVPQYALFQRDYTVLRELNANGGKRFKEIDKDNGLPSGSARYAYYKLLDSGIVKRVTIQENNLPIAYDSVVLFRLTNVDVFQGTRNQYRTDLIRTTKEPYNGYSLIFDIYDPGGFMAFVPIPRGGSIDDKVDMLRGSVKGAELETMIITDVLIGQLSHRKFDNAYSQQYQVLLKEKMVEPMERIPYNML